MRGERDVETYQEVRQVSDEELAFLRLAGESLGGINTDSVTHTLKIKSKIQKFREDTQNDAYVR